MVNAVDGSLDLTLNTTESQYARPSFTRSNASRHLQECRAYWQDALEKRISQISRLGLLSGGAVSLAAAWDDEITALNSIVASAQMRRNALAPWASLPAEILSRVFEGMAIEDSLGNMNSSRLRNQAGLPFLTTEWLVVTRVCRRWREVAIGHATLWSNLSNKHGMPWETYLQRAGTCSLSIEAFFQDSFESVGYDKKIQLITQHLHHVRQLHL